MVRIQTIHRTRSVCLYDENALLTARDTVEILNVEEEVTLVFQNHNLVITMQVKMIRVAADTTPDSLSYYNTPAFGRRIPLTVYQDSSCIHKRILVILVGYPGGVSLIRKLFFMNFEFLLRHSHTPVSVIGMINNNQYHHPFCFFNSIGATSP